MADRLFISHASEDAAVAEKIVAYLEARGVPCWISSRDIPPQSIYADAIAEGMQECGVCAVVLSAASNRSKAVKRELELASHYDKPFIPIRVDSTEPGHGFDYYLRNTQWVDYGRHGESALDRIIGRSAASPTAPPRTVPTAQASAPEQKDGRRSVLITSAAVVAIALALWALAQVQPAAPPATEIAEISPAETMPAPITANDSAAAAAPVDTHSAPTGNSVASDQAQHAGPPSEDPDLLPPRTASEPAPTEPPRLRAVSSWEGTESAFEIPRAFVLLEDGTVCVATSLDEVYAYGDVCAHGSVTHLNGGTWSGDQTSIAIDMNMSSFVYRGTVRGDAFSGVLEPAEGVTFSMRRRPNRQ